MIKFIVFFVLIFSNIIPDIIAENINTAAGKVKKIRVLTSPDYPPFEFLDGNAKIIGLEFDLLKEIEERTGFIFEINKAEFGAIIGALIYDKADLGVSGFTITSDREKNVQFANYDMSNDIGILTHLENSPKDLRDLHGKIIITQIGTIADEKLKKINKDLQLGIQIESVKDNSIGMQMLNAHKVYGFCLESLVASSFKGNLSVNTAFYTIEHSISKYGFAIRKELPEAKEIQNAMKSIIEDGTYAKIVKKWSLFADGNVKKDKSKIYVDSLKICLGALNTLKICLISSIFALIFATPISIVRYTQSKHIISKCATGFVSVIRGTPIILQLSFWYFCVPIVLKYDITPIEAGILTLTVNSTAYLSEIIRGGLKTLDKGQIEAAISLNLSYFQTYKDVILPQLLKNVLPMLTSEFIVLIKESSVLSIFGVEEITFRGNVVIGQYYTYILPIAVSGATYYILCFIIERLGKYLEKKFHH